MVRLRSINIMARTIADFRTSVKNGRGRCGAVRGAALNLVVAVSAGNIPRVDKQMDAIQYLPDASRRKRAYLFSQVSLIHGKYL